MFSGKGIYANLDNKSIIMGNEKFITDNNIEISSDIKKQVNSKRLEGKIALIVVVDKEPKGLIALSDTLKDTTIPALSKLNKTSDTILLTGDNSLTADYFAKKSGIKTVYSGLLPKEKAGKIEELQKENKKVLMTVDGVNDALTLKVAAVGVLMGNIRL